MANHVMTRPVSSRILLAISSLYRDIERGQRTPSSGTLALVVKGIGLLQQQLKSADIVSDDTILAMINLWAYEATLSMGFATEDHIVPKTLSNNIQTHLSGLQRSIRCRGGLRSLSSETLWQMAWCVSTMPGYSPIDTRIMEPASSKTRPQHTDVDDYYCLSRLLDTLSNIRRRTSSPDALSDVLDDPQFSYLRKTLLRLHVMRHSIPKTDRLMTTLGKAIALASALLFIFDLLLGGIDCVHRDGRGRRNELLRAQERLVEHGVGEEGSFVLVWSVLMTQQEVPTLELHPRAWSTVEMTNVVKHLNVSTIDMVSQLLMGYLLPEARPDATEDYRYERLLVQIHSELDILTDLG